MANEITLLDSAGTDVKGAKIEFAYRFDIPKPAMLASGETVIPSPTSQLNDDLRRILSDTEKDALDRGEAAIVRDDFRWKPSWTTQEAVQAARNQYDEAKTEFESNYTDAYRYVGVRIDR